MQIIISAADEHFSYSLVWYARGERKKQLIWFKSLKWSGNDDDDDDGIGEWLFI